MIQLPLQLHMVGSSCLMQRWGSVRAAGSQHPPAAARSGSSTNTGRTAIRSQVSCSEVNVNTNTTARELDLQQQRRCALAAARGSPPGGYVAACLSVKGACVGEREGVSRPPTGGRQAGGRGPFGAAARQGARPACAAAALPSPGVD